MNTDTDSGAPGGLPPARGPRIHRASSGHVKSPRKILVVDDNKVVLKTTTIKLQAAGYEVLTAEDGSSAIRQARQLDPHLILLDLNFPPDVGHGGGIPWDGLLILTWLRTNGMHKIPVIVITGEDLEKYKERLMKAGVLDIFLKPLDYAALLTAIRWALDEEVAPAAPGGMDALEQAAEEPPAVEPAAGRRILLVDDTNDWRYLGAAFLGERGYEVVTAEDPIKAMVHVAQFKPNLVILDLNLGGQSAVTLMKLLSERQPELPILIYTGMDLDNAEVSDLFSQGAWNWLRKGSLEQLGTAVEKTIKGPKGNFVQSPPEPAEYETAEAFLAPVENGGHVAEDEPEPEPECGTVFRSLDGLRAGSTTELLSALGSTRSITPEEQAVAPEPIVVPDEVIESAAESILIVEDDAAFSDTVRSFLESQSFRVSAVSTGAEAVSLITAVDVDLILFDLTLPDFSVRKFYEELNALKPHLCPRIIYMTSDDSHPADDGFVRRLKGISVWKPFPMDWLLEAVQTIRGGTQQERLAAK